MELILLVIGLLTCFHLLCTSVEFQWGCKRISNLSSQENLPDEELPFVSIIFSALNEEAALERAVNALLKLDYPRLEIIAINDRSTDDTPHILDKLSSQSPRLRVYHIQELPEGWLGKNHALNFAAQKARGEWLLFTDADVIMEACALKKAISYVLVNGIDHLTIYEYHLRKSFWLKVLMLGSYLTYSMVIKPWRIRYTWSKKYLGHGAFNLVNKAAYQHCGGHRAIAMECLDDLMLGRLLKQNGYQQDIIDGNKLIKREWYHSASAMIKGLKKNSFAYFNFNLFAVIRDSFFALVYYFWPLIAVFVFTGPIQWINIVNIILFFNFSQAVAKRFHLHPGFFLMYPISVGMLLYTILLSVYSTYKNNGVIWRDTHYSLAKLRYKKPANLQEE